MSEENKMSAKRAKRMRRLQKVNATERKVIDRCHLCGAPLFYGYEKGEIIFVNDRMLDILGMRCI